MLRTAALLLLMSLVPLNPITAPAAASPLSQSFQEAGVEGTLRIERLGDGRRWVHDAERAARRMLPASTFKIPHSLFALHVGAVESVDEIVPWDGKHRQIEAWNRPLSLRQAIAVSAVPVYEEIARRIGVERMQAEIERTGYGNQNIGGTIHRFWLRGPLMISADEQIGFLKKLHARSLPYSRAHQEAVIDIIELKRGDGWVLRAKTGWALSADPDVGWLVGWLEAGEEVYVFAINIDIVDRSDLLARRDVVLDALEEITGLRLK